MKQKEEKYLFRKFADNGNDDDDDDDLIELCIDEEERETHPKQHNTNVSAQQSSLLSKQTHDTPKGPAPALDAHDALSFLKRHTQNTESASLSDTHSLFEKKSLFDRLRPPQGGGEREGGRGSGASALPRAPTAAASISVVNANTAATNFLALALGSQKKTESVSSSNSGVKNSTAVDGLMGSKIPLDQPVTLSSAAAAARARKLGLTTTSILSAIPSAPPLASRLAAMIGNNTVGSSINSSSIHSTAGIPQTESKSNNANNSSSAYSYARNVSVASRATSSGFLNKLRQEEAVAAAAAQGAKASSTNVVVGEARVADHHDLLGLDVEDVNGNTITLEGDTTTQHQRRDRRKVITWGDGGVSGKSSLLLCDANGGENTNKETETSKRRGGKKDSSAVVAVSGRKRERAEEQETRTDNNDDNIGRGARSSRSSHSNGNNNSNPPPIQDATDNGIKHSKDLLRQEVVIRSTSSSSRAKPPSLSSPLDKPPPLTTNSLRVPAFMIATRRTFLPERNKSNNNDNENTGYHTLTTDAHRLRHRVGGVVCRAEEEKDKIQDDDQKEAVKNKKRRILSEGGKHGLAVAVDTDDGRKGHTPVGSKSNSKNSGKRESNGNGSFSTNNSSPLAGMLRYSVGEEEMRKASSFSSTVQHPSLGISREESAIMDDSFF